MTKEELIAALSALGGDPPMQDWEVNHERADGLLLAYIDDDAVREAFGAIKKWYA